MRYSIAVKADLEQVKKITQRFETATTDLEREAIFGAINTALLDLVAKYTQERTILNPAYNTPRWPKSAHEEWLRERDQREQR